MYNEKINPITARFKDPSTENTYCQFAMENYRNRLIFVFLSIIAIYIGFSIYDLTNIPLENSYLLFALRIITCVSALWCIYWLNQKNKAKYMNGMMVFLATSVILPVYYNHIMDAHSYEPFTFESSIFLFIFYAITRGALLLIPFIYIFGAISIQTLLFLLDSFGHHHIEIDEHLPHILIYLMVLGFILFVSYNFNVMIRRGFYDRHILASRLKKSNIKLQNLVNIESSFLAETTAQVIAHEIKNSIGVISSYAQMLIVAKSIKGENKTMAENIKKSSDKADKYIREIRNFSMGKTNIKTHNIADIINDAQTLWQTATEKYNPTININLTDCNIKTDNALLGGAISNIVRNAIESKKNGIINIENKVIGDNLHISISNNKKIKANTKDMFTLLKRNSNKQGSTGIGLSFSKSVVEKFGGKLTLKKGKDKTTFIFVIPLN